MKEYEPRKTDQILADFSARHKTVADGLTARRIEDLWMQLFGDTARRYTARVLFSGGHLTVEVSNDAWKNELMLTRTSIRERLNGLLGYAAVSHVYFV